MHKKSHESGFLQEDDCLRGLLFAIDAERYVV